MPAGERAAQSILGGGLSRSFEAAVRDATAGIPGTGMLSNVRDLRELVAAADEHCPGLVLLDSNWLADQGLGLLAELHDVPAPPAVLLCGKPLPALATVQALRLGLRGVLAQEAGPAVIAKALAAVLRGEFWFGHGEAAQVLALLAHAPEPSLQHVWRNLSMLTERENAVLVELLAGRSNHEISERLAISEQTVKVHLQHVFLKLGVHRRTDLLAASATGLPEG